MPKYQKKLTNIEQKADMVFSFCVYIDNCRRDQNMSWSSCHVEGIKCNSSASEQDVVRQLAVWHFE